MGFSMIVLLFIYLFVICEHANDDTGRVLLLMMHINYAHVLCTISQ